MNSTRFHSSPAYRELLAAQGLNSFEALFHYAAGEEEAAPSPHPLPSRERGEEEATPDGKRHLLRRLQTAHPPYITAAGRATRNLEPVVVTRFTLRDAAGGEVVLVLKRESRPGLGRQPRSRSRREWRNLTALHDRGIAAAEPVAVGERRRWGVVRQAFILVREPMGTVSVAEYLQGGPAAGERRELARELGGVIRRMHDGGLAYRDLYARHILIHPDRSAGLLGPMLVNAEWAYRFPNLAPHFRWHDLATLLVTTAYPACSAADRLRFALAYGRQSRLSADLKVLIRRVVGRAARMRSRGLERFLGLERLPPRMVALGGAAAGQRAMAAERFLAELRRLGLGSFEAIMNYAGGDSYRVAPGRWTVRIPVTGPDGRASGIYLKRHDRLETGEWLAGLLRRRGPRSPGEIEFENIFRLALAGLAAPTAVAVGYERGRGLGGRSFLITEELAGTVPADDFIKREFGAASSGEKPDTRLVPGLNPSSGRCGHPLPRERDEEKATATPSGKQPLTAAAANSASALHNPRSDARKRELVRQIARLVRRFHRAGFYHRDLYLCHIFVREERGNFALYLIDLQRVRQKRPGQVGRRWLVKDLAALNYSAPAGIITRTDRMRFVRDYLGLKRLDGVARKLVGSVVAKTGRIARHDEKKRG
jgi:tRNA A-37 threonylcarbamoyl transferase component Bud32